MVIIDLQLVAIEVRGTLERLATITKAGATRAWPHSRRPFWEKRDKPSEAIPGEMEIVVYCSTRSKQCPSALGGRPRIGAVGGQLGNCDAEANLRRRGFVGPPNWSRRERDPEAG
jgi:hypothetical protein